MTESKLKYPTLAAALAAFQSEVPRVTKSASADTGKYSYDYAPLEVITPIVLPLLASVGLAYTAAPHLDENGNFGLQAKLIHESGEEFGGFYPLGNPGAPAQAIGSAISYARRYALLSLTGVAPDNEDDDGKRGGEAAGANIKAPEAAKETAATIKAQLVALIKDDSNGLTGDRANEIMAEITNDKAPGEWNITDLRKGVAAAKKEFGI